LALHFIARREAESRVCRAPVVAGVDCSGLHFPKALSFNPLPFRIRPWAAFSAASAGAGNGTVSTERAKMAIAWTSDLDTGIEAIDQQHRKIVDYINELEVAILKKDSAATGRVLDGLEEYCRLQFAFEEELQVKAGYKHAASHKMVHDVFTKRMAKYRERHKAGEDIAGLLHEALSTWLLLHIKREDKNFVPDVKRSMGGMVSGDDGGDWLSRSVSGFFGKGR
jgi:hemerythrin